MFQPSKFVSIAALVVGVGIGAAIAKAPAAKPTADVVYSGDTTIIGQPIVYPDGAPKITASVVTMEPGATTGWHKHNVPLFAYVLSGELEVDYGPLGTKTYTPGVAFFEAFETRHTGTNIGTDPVKILVLAIGAVGVPVTTPLPN